LQLESFREQAGDEQDQFRQMSKDLNYLVLSSLSDLNTLQGEVQHNKLVQAQQKISEVSRILATLPQSTMMEQPAIISHNN